MIFSATFLEPRRIGDSVSFVGFPAAQHEWSDPLFSLHWCASPWISRSAGSIRTRTAGRRISTILLNPLTEFGGWLARFQALHDRVEQDVAVGHPRDRPWAPPHGAPRRDRGQGDEVRLFRVSRELTPRPRIGYSVPWSIQALALARATSFASASVS